MHNDLNIPLDTHTTRQNTWRVVWLILGTAMLFAIGWCIFRVATTIDTVSSLRPENTYASLQFNGSKRINPVIAERIGSQQIFAGEPFAFNTLFAESHRQIALHFDDTWSLTGISVDKNIDVELRKRLQARGLTVFVHGGRTLVSTSGNVINETRWNPAPESIFPQYIGRLFIRAENEPTSKRLSLRRQGFVVHGLRTEAPATESPVAPEGARIIAFLPFSGTGTPATAAGLLASLPVDDFNAFFLENPLSITVFEDVEGTGYAISTQNTSVNIDLMTKLANELISSQTVSTTALTLPDGTTVQEIRAQRGSIQSNITTDVSETRVLLQNDQETSILLRKTESGHVLLANRAFVIETPLTSGSSQCDRSALYFTQPSAVLRSISEPALPNTSNGASLTQTMFREIAITKRHTTLCW